ncbi:MAG: type IX secretion system membrane protein PorP/SprF, partial [Sphingobacteriales bacterium]
AQDIHFSQFQEATILRNPSLIGIYSEDYKLTGQTRNQWTNVGKGFRTGMLTGEFRVAAGRGSADFISFGLLGYSDKAGAINFRTTGIYPAITYNKSLEDDYNTYLSLGFTGGYVTRTIDLTKMTFDNQYQNGGYDPLNGSGESNLPDPRLSHYDLGTGASLNSSPSDQLSYYVGLAAYHFTKPKRSFYPGKDLIRMQTRWSANAGMSWFIDDTWSLTVHGNYMRQGSYQEVMAGGLIKWSRTSYGNATGFGISGGMYYRMGDAMIPALTVNYKGQSFGFSYDINTSSLKEATRMMGGFEVTVTHKGFFYGGPEDKRSCPRF